MAKSGLGEIMPRRMAGSRTGPQLPRCPAGCWRPWRDVPRAGRPSSGASCGKPPFTTRPHGSEPAGQRPGRGPHACWPQWAPKGIVPPPPAAGARGSEVASSSAGARPWLRGCQAIGSCWRRKPCRLRQKRRTCKNGPSELSGCFRKGNVRIWLERAKTRADMYKARIGKLAGCALQPLLHVPAFARGKNARHFDKKRSEIRSRHICTLGAATTGPHHEVSGAYLEKSRTLGAATTGPHHEVT